MGGRLEHGVCPSRPAGHRSSHGRGKAITLVESIKAVNRCAKDAWKVLRGSLLYIDGERRSLMSWGPKEYSPEPYYSQNDWMARDINRMSRANQLLDARSMQISRMRSA
jgi:hypothetical protein